jgi:hypothetical protein
MKREKVSESANEHLRSSYFLTHIIKMFRTKHDETEDARSTNCRDENSYRILVRNVHERDHYRYLWVYNTERTLN